MQVVHIHRPKGYYIAQIRRRGAQRWETIGRPVRNEKTAMARAIRAMTPQHKRARVLFCADYYDPTISMELKR